MHIFLVHTQAGHDPIVVRDGFSLSAFLFTGVWALWHRMWSLAIIIFCGWGSLNFFLSIIDVPVELGFLIIFTVSALIGFSANDWRSTSLLRRGYTLAGVVSERYQDAALRRWSELNGRVGM